MEKTKEVLVQKVKEYEEVIEDIEKNGVSEYTKDLAEEYRGRVWAYKDVLNYLDLK